MAPAVPIIERADDRHALGVGRPHGEADSVDAVERQRMRAELAVELEVAPLADQIDVELAENRLKTIWVFDLCDAAPDCDAQPVAQVALAAWKRACEEAGPIDALEHPQACPAAGVDDLDARRVRRKRADGKRLGFTAAVGTENGERIGVVPAHDRGHVRVIRLKRHRCFVRRRERS